MSAPSESMTTMGGGGTATASLRPVSVKIVVGGGFGVGKTTFVSSLSEIEPLRTEAVMTSAAVGVDDHAAVATKETTTVAMDFGRLTVDELLVLYLFGTPGQDRFGFMWDDVVEGCLGAVVLVDTSRLDDCFPAIDYFEHRGVPIVVGVNRFPGTPTHSLDDVRQALDLSPDVPMAELDARDRAGCRDTLLALLLHLAERDGVPT